MSEENKAEENGAATIGSTSFRDANGREWSLALNVLNVDRVKDTTGEDLLSMEDVGEVAAKIYTDDVFVCKVAHAICKSKIDADPNIDDEAFATAISNGNIIEKMADALANAIVLFTSSRRRATVAAMMGKAKTAIDKAATLAERRMNDGTFERAIDKELADADAKLSSLAPG